MDRGCTVFCNGEFSVFSGIKVSSILFSWDLANIVDGPFGHMECDMSCQDTMASMFVLCIVLLFMLLGLGAKHYLVTMIASMQIVLFMHYLFFSFNLRVN